MLLATLALLGTSLHSPEIPATLAVSGFQLEQPRIALQPSELRIDVPVDGLDTTWVLWPHSVRQGDLRVWSYGDGDQLEPSLAGPAQTYRGHVLGAPERRVVAGIVEGGVRGMLREPDGRATFLEPASRHLPGLAPGLHVVHSSEELALPAGYCGSESLAWVDPQGVGGGTFTNGPQGGASCFRVSELAFDVDYEYFLAAGGTVPNTVADIEAVMLAVNLIFAHEVQIEHVLTEVVVRDAEPDPYNSSTPGTLLDILRSEWNSTLAGIQRDHVHLATGREMEGNIIGLAYVGVVCNLPFAYGLTQFNLGFGGHVAVVAHELGHNWNAPHCLDDICGIMCGGCVSEFGPITTEVILNYRDAVACLDVTDGFATPTAPEAERDEATGAVQILIDVLANDLDGNCDTVVIDSFDSATQEGGSVFLSSATGPDGRDELRYVPAPGFQGIDGFAYTAGDGTGLTEGAPVTVTTFDEYPDLAGHWRLDESSGPDLIDSSANAMAGTFLGSPVYGQPGAAPGTGTSVRFGTFGARGRVIQAAQLRGLTETFSISAWVAPNSIAGSDRVFGNGSSWRFALRDGQPTLSLDGLGDITHAAAVPVGAWTHLAATYSSSAGARIYVNGQPAFDAPSLGSAGAATTEWYLGGGSGVTTALFDGRLDDIQVYDQVLGDEAVASLFTNPGSVWAACKEPLTYCSSNPNSTGFAVVLDVQGEPSLAAGSLPLAASPIPVGQFGLFFFGDSPTLQPFGQGQLCVSGQIIRLAPVLPDGLGLAQSTLQLDNPAYGLGMGDRLLLQYWYRDPIGGGAGFNLSSGVAVDVCP